MYLQSLIIFGFDIKMFRLRNQASLAQNCFKTLSYKPTNSFNDLLKQPIQSYTQNSFINLDIVIY